MSKQLDRQLLKVLKRIRRIVRERLSEGEKVGAGICHLVSIHNGVRDWEQHDRLKELFVLWPKYSGCERYPVPSPKGHLSPMKKFTNACRKDSFWNGKYGRLRMELLEWLIDYLKAKTK